MEDYPYLRDLYERLLTADSTICCIHVVGTGQEAISLARDLMPDVSLHNQDTIYFLAQYKDPTESLRRAPWVKQPDGSWKKIPGSEAYYEDEFALIWNVNDSIKGFNQQGCAVACHGLQNKGGVAAPPTIPEVRVVLK